MSQLVHYEIKGEQRHVSDPMVIKSITMNKEIQRLLIENRTVMLLGEHAPAKHYWQGFYAICFRVIKSWTNGAVSRWPIMVAF